MRKESEGSFSYLVTVSYDGSGFSGWAKQTNKFTVQGYIEKVLSKIFRRDVALNSISRLDKGVHAVNQKFLFCLNLKFEKQKLLFLLAKALKLIQIKNVRLVKNGFLTLNSLVFKEYRYFINIGKFNLWKVNYRWEYCSFLSVNKLQNILNIFVGNHDFFNFCYCKQKDWERKNTWREIDLIQVQQRGSTIVIIIRGKGFLRYQVRFIIGEAIQCYENKQTLESLKRKLFQPEKLNNKHHSLAPPTGLYLWKIKFR